MPLRLLEVLGPEEELRRVPGLLEDLDLVDLWTEVGEDGKAVVRIILRTDMAESVTDTLADELSGAEGLRMVLLSVEATIPAPEEEGPPAGSEVEDETAKRPPSRVSRDELYQDLSVAAQVSAVYLVTVGLSAVVAAVGLLRGDVAVLIGAMVIAPLLGPNVALSLAVTLGDGGLARRAVKATASGAVTVLLLSLMIGLVVSVDPTVSTLVARTRVGFGDVALALAAGSAGTLAYTSGLPAAVVGVMVAVALLPPLVVAGLMVGSGNLGLALGAFLLVVTNVVCVNLAGVATFLVQKVRPRTWWEAERAKRATVKAAVTWLALLAVLAVVLWLRT